MAVSRNGSVSRPAVRTPVAASAATPRGPRVPRVPRTTTARANPPRITPGGVRQGGVKPLGARITRAIRAGAVPASVFKPGAGNFRTQVAAAVSKLPPGRAKALKSSASTFAKAQTAKNKAAQAQRRNITSQPRATLPRGR